jgi:hypothetical protein
VCTASLSSSRSSTTGSTAPSAPSTTAIIQITSPPLTSIIFSSFRFHVVPIHTLLFQFFVPIKVRLLFGIIVFLFNFFFRVYFVVVVVVVASSLLAAKFGIFVVVIVIIVIILSIETQEFPSSLFFGDFILFSVLVEPRV